MTLACEEVNSKLVEVVTVADVDAENRVAYNILKLALVKISTLDLDEMLMFG